MGRLQVRICSHIVAVLPEECDWARLEGLIILFKKGHSCEMTVALCARLLVGSRQRTSEINVANCDAGPSWNDDIIRLSECGGRSERL